MDTVKLKSAEEYLPELFEEPYDLENDNSIESDFYKIIKEAQRNAIEYALTLASENADAEVEFMGWLADQHERMKFIEGEDYEVYVINSSILNLRETLFKENNLT